ncbi:MAG TPA: TIGR04283 family arsenosugar biosynthesis glycosyltransferase [Usitatibacter sp.]|nr:TIGR04283 family arsenosugar biosynthesis glycosyltransferase [Usitatibacter sp.]
MPHFSIVVPALDEARAIEAALTPLQPHRTAGIAEVVVVDGGSRDSTRALAAPLADRVIESARGRAHQMNAGAAASSGHVLLFLHADTRLPGDALSTIDAALAGGGEWGRFDVGIEGRAPLLPLVAWMMNARSRWSGIATGDQAMFMRRAAFEAVGGFPAIPLMEDVALSRLLRARSFPICLRARVVTSGRRWERHGTLRTIVLMWRLRVAYALGADPHQLARRYDIERTSG